MSDTWGRSYHVHTIEIHTKKPWPGMLKAIRRTLVDPDHDLKRRGRTKGKKETRRKFKPNPPVAIHYPTERTRLLLARWQLMGKDFNISKVHVACDQHMDDTGELGERMEDMFDTLRLKSAPPRAKPFRYPSGDYYFVDYRNRPRLRRNCFVYSKCLHVRTELRFLNADGVERNGLDDMNSLRSMDLTALFFKHLHGWE